MIFHGCFNAADPQRRRLFLCIVLMRALQSIKDPMLHMSDKELLHSENKALCAAGRGEQPEIDTDELIYYQYCRDSDS
jgi:hypothetical protein